MSTHTAPPPVPAPPGVRASDAEREQTVAHLHDALGEGRLDLPETETRIGAAYAAQYRGELTVLLDDLPSATAAVPGGSAPGGSGPGCPAVWESLVWRARTVVWGAGASRPTRSHLRAAVVAIVAAVLWLALWAVLGAIAVAP